MELPWVDDVLGEALALITDWDDHPSPVADAPREHSSNTGTTLRENSTTPANDKKRSHETIAVASVAGIPACVPPPRRAVKINLSRERQKQEILSLQESVAELEEELARVKLRGGKKLRIDDTLNRTGTASTATVTRETNGSVVAWENAARRQFRSRRRAEAVNTKLRDLLSTQMAVAEDLIRVIQRAESARQEAQQMALFPASTPVFPMVDPVNDQHLRRRLLTISTQWHVPFAKCDQFHNRAGRARELLFYDITATREGSEALVLDIRASTPSTFPLQTVETVLWNYFLTLRCTEDDFSLATESKESVDTLVGCIRATASHDGIHGVVTNRFMKERFRNVDGELVIAAAHCGRPDLQSTTAAPGDDDHLTTIDAILFEDSWLRVFRVDGARDEKGPTPDPAAPSYGGITLIQHVRRTRIQFCGASKPDTRQIDAVEKFFTRLAENQLRWSQEVMERAMILGSKNALLP